jgi:hypothetical protein
MHLLTELILRMQPYPQQLKEYCRVNPDFALALKTVHPDKFVSLGAVIVSQCPIVPEDEIIGFLVYDYGAKPETFKQDFIVNIGGKNNEFVIYTRYSKVRKSKYIKDISQFFQKYPTYSKDIHHPSFESIPIELKPMAIRAIELANRIKTFGLRQELSDEEYEKFDAVLKKFNL